MDGGTGSPSHERRRVRRADEAGRRFTLQTTPKRFSDEESAQAARNERRADYLEGPVSVVSARSIAAAASRIDLGRTFV